MAAPERVDANEIWLGTHDTPTDKRYCQANDLTFAQLAQFLRNLTTGTASDIGSGTVRCLVFKVA